MSEGAKHTPLFDLHNELGGKMVEFAGWQLPIQYPSGLMTEHKQCREKAALFDVSHMGQIELHGPGAAQQLEQLVPSNITNLEPGRARYTFFTNDQGGILDDLIVANTGNHLFLVVNASMYDQDTKHLKDHLNGVEMREIDDHALLALQGPMAEKVLQAHCPGVTSLKFMQTMKTDLNGVEIRVSRLGYTGEDGFELSVPKDHALEFSRLLLDHEDCAPAGLGARDSLRLEAGLCLYGNDIDQTTSPIEASLTWAIQKRRREEGGFPGAERILSELHNGATRKLVGIVPDGRAPARAGTEIGTSNGDIIGHVTSGGFGPTVQGPVAMGYVSTDHAEPGTSVELLIRGKSHPAKIAAMPFVAHHYKH